MTDFKVGDRVRFRENIQGLKGQQLPRKVLTIRHITTDKDGNQLHFGGMVIYHEKWFEHA